MWVSEALLREVEENERLNIVEAPRPMGFDEDGSLL
jgi:hypothetical protein